jgi:hypothetical protein
MLPWGSIQTAESIQFRCMAELILLAADPYCPKGKKLDPRIGCAGIKITVTASQYIKWYV